MLNMQSIIRIPEQVLFEDLNGEAVLLNRQDGQYYGLDEVGSRIWTLLVERHKVEAVFQVMLDEYSVDAETLQQDLLDLIEVLAARKLVVVEDAIPGEI